LTKHYHGDDADLQTLMGGMLEAFADHSVERYCAAAEGYLRAGGHPTLQRALLACAYAPMIDLLQYLEANGFTNYIASGGDRDFMRPVTHELYAIPSERVIGSSNALQWTDDEREFAYTGGAEQALERAAEHGWTVASIKRDWAAVFPAG
jgi:hypothetical protein